VSGMRAAVAISQVASPRSQWRSMLVLAARQFARVSSSQPQPPTIWQLDEEDCTVRRLTIDPCPMRRARVGDWSVFVSEQLIRELTAQRAVKLPNETGGILIGECDTARRRIYLVGSIAAPPDSVEWPTHYIRGSRGLQRKVDEVTKRTDGMLRYVGEWHSHPDGTPCRPSADDDKAYAWLAEHLRAEGYPPVMGDRWRGWLAVLRSGRAG